MAPKFSKLAEEIAKVCDKIRQGTRISIDSNKTNEGLMIYHDALLVLCISDLPDDKQRALCASANQRFEKIEPDQLFPPREHEGRTFTSTAVDLLTTSGAMQAGREVERGTDMELYFRLMALPKETQQAVVDVVSAMRGGEAKAGGRGHGREHDEAEYEGENLARQGEEAQQAQQAQHALQVLQAPQAPQAQPAPQSQPTQQATGHQEREYHGNKGYYMQQEGGH